MDNSTPLISKAVKLLQSLPPAQQQLVLRFIDYLIKRNEDKKQQSVREPAQSSYREEENQSLNNSPFDRLHGIISLPESFDHRTFLGDEFLDQ
jgi:hypothetical protein